MRTATRVRASDDRNTDIEMTESATGGGGDGPELVISVQPTPAAPLTVDGEARAALPMPGGWGRAADDERGGAAPRGQFIPVSGLDFLIGVDALLIHQTVDTIGASSAIELENQYTVRAVIEAVVGGAGSQVGPGGAGGAGGAAAGEALYIGRETSSALQRCLCGAGRALALTLQDGTRQVALRMHRRLAAASCLCPCRLQEMRVWSPGVAGVEEYVGRVQQQWAWMVPLFLVRDSSDDVLFVLEGPAALCAGAYLKRAHFKILSADSLREEGQIEHRWNRELVNHTTTLQMPRRAVQPRHKALLLAAAFLLEFTYFERENIRNCCSANCF